ncbi:hypothetical protein BOTBODRAFT_26200 [Botryobasidium botryosum FD-172 SS1]|uniref:Sodium/calcium exchanger membrane region domain-containing protein n=1 Tax=Botryobasidium botryosum (strain FD-172 SS1) TaxID=930990 RepID=A0A067NDB6_BOTB1|nr:hypothetical protein BOTBODRAFT_26200 [Botryobasidium botryosum FD-172 SS1]
MEKGHPGGPGVTRSSSEEISLGPYPPTLGAGSSNRTSDHLEYYHSRFPASESTFAGFSSSHKDAQPANQYDLEADYRLHPDLSGRPHQHIHLADVPSTSRRFFLRLAGYGRELPSYAESLRNICTSSWLNILIPFVPLAWVAHFHHWGGKYAFGFSFVGIIPLEKLFEYGGEQLALYCGKSIGDLVIITLNNTVEITLAIILLGNCELKLLQSTIIGVILLHILLVPGAAFMAGGARIWEQHLNPFATQLNQSLMTMSVLTLLIPAALFAALYGNDYGPGAGELHRNSTAAASEHGGATAEAAHGIAVRSVFRLTEHVPAPAVSDETKLRILHISRACAIMLLIVYIASRFYLHNPPGEDADEKRMADAPEALRRAEEETLEEKPELRPLVCVILLLITVPLTAFTLEWLVESIDKIRHDTRITTEWFGLVLLPIASFSADALVTIGYFVRKYFRNSIGPPAALAQSRSIDLSIQFALFWMPFLVLLGWVTQKPFTLLFDLFEVAVLFGACFLVNYVTQDAKTNWAEGLMMVMFYMMIATAAWYYDGQTAIRFMAGDECQSVVASIAREGAEAAAAGH